GFPPKMSGKMRPNIQTWKQSFQIPERSARPERRNRTRSLVDCLLFLVKVTRADLPLKALGPISAIHTKLTRKFIHKMAAAVTMFPSSINLTSRYLNPLSDQTRHKLDPNLSSDSLRQTSGKTPQTPRCLALQLHQPHRSSKMTSRQALSKIKRVQFQQSLL